MFLEELCEEAEKSYLDQNYFAAFVYLFIIAEQIIKHSVDLNEGNFHEASKIALENGHINNAESNFINDLKQIRNEIFHENHYSLGIELGPNQFL